MRVDTASNPSRIVFRGGLAAVGRFDCPVEHPVFARTSRTSGHLVVFPHDPVTIHHDGAPGPLVADAHHITFYDDGQEYRRSALSSRGDHCDFLVFSETAVRAAIHRHAPRDAGGRRPFGGLTHGPSDARAHLAMRTLVAAARAVLARCYAEPMQLAALAAAVGASEFHLARVFRKETGRTLHGWRHALRLRAAVDRVLGGAADLTAVALDVGFSSHSHLTTALHAALGLTPSRLRALIAAGVSMPQAPCCYLLPALL